MQLYEYNGYTIYPTPRLAVGYGYWKVELTIRCGRTIKEYSSDNTFFTKGEAVFNCIRYGKELIDDGIVMLKEAV